MRNFVLKRNEDVSGVSGTGIVAEGVEFSDKTVAVRWIVGDYHSTVIWPDIESVNVIHGHDGKTEIVWLPDSVYPDNTINNMLNNYYANCLRQEAKTLEYLANSFEKGEPVNDIGAF